jgi:ComF family protein
VWLGSEAREVIHHLKYEGYTRLATDMATMMTRSIRRPSDGVVVPIPLGRRRQRHRGYNQAAEIARALTTRWRLPMREGVLRRTRETRSQTALTPAARRDNVADAFLASTPSDARPTRRTSRTIILVDDVMTTGATLSAAATALALAGWSSVGAVTFARALPFAAQVSNDR